MGRSRLTMQQARDVEGELRCLEEDPTVSKRELRRSLAVAMDRLVNDPLRRWDEAEAKRRKRAGR